MSDITYYELFGDWKGHQSLDCMWIPDDLVASTSFSVSSMGSHLVAIIVSETETFY